MMRRSPMKPGKGFKPRTAPIATAGVLRVAAVQREAKTRAPKLKSRGMKGRAPTATEAQFMDAVAKVGCLPCRKDGVENLHVSIHHIDGRTKPGAHFLVLALCGPHHQQDDTDAVHRISVHGAKKPFEARYGTQLELLAECIAIIKSGTDSTAIESAPEHLSLEQ